MRQTKNRRGSVLRASAVAVATASAAQLAHAAAVPAVYQHTNSIDLSSQFGTTGAYGTHPMGLAFDGTNAYVGGMNDSVASPGTAVGIVQVQGVLGATPTLAGQANTIITADITRGLQQLAYDAGTNSVYSMFDGNPGYFVERWNLTNGNTAMASAWKTTAAVGGFARPFAIAISPKGDNGSPAVGYLSQGNGRELTLRLSDGTPVYKPSGQGNDGPFLLAQEPSSLTPGFGSLWRGLAYDSAGNLIASEGQGLLVGLRKAAPTDNNVYRTFTKPDGSVSTGTSVLDKKSEAPFNNFGQGVAVIEGLDPGTMVAFSSRVGNTGASTPMTLTDHSGATQPGLTTAQVHIRRLGDLSNADPLLESQFAGSTTGVAQPELFGNEDGIGAAWTGDRKNVVAAKDANGLPVLLVTSYNERRLDVYQVEPTWVASTGGTWGTTGAWLAGVSPNAATLNARFAPDANHQTISLDGEKTTKGLKLEGAGGYTIAGPGVLKVDAPASRSGQISATGGAHAITADVNLAKPTAVTIGDGASLTLGGKVTGLVNGLTLGAGAKIDIGKNGFGVNWTPSSDPGVDNNALPAIVAQIAAAYNKGKWNGTNPAGGVITSSAAALNSATAIGYGDNEELGYTNFNGVFVDATTALIKYTWYGDLNLDGVVTSAEAITLTANLGQPLTGWTNGDLNGDGKVSADDLALLNLGVAASGGQNISSVPEPTTLTALAASALALTARRRRAAR